MLLILDLDETLFHAREVPLERIADFKIGSYHAYKRPELSYFLEKTTALFELAVWTSATADYARIAVDYLFPEPNKLCFLWSRDRCVRRFNPETYQEYWIKDLKKVKNVGYNLEQVLALDDSPEKLERNYGNWVPIKPFFGDEADKELLRVLPFLEDLTHEPNVRHIEKRYWNRLANSNT